MPPKRRREEGMPSLSVVTIGAGYFSRFHVEAWQRNPETALVGLADLDGAKAAALLAEFGATQAKAASDAAQLLAEIRPDIVDIAAPPNAHLPLIELATAFRPKVIICQKPFCGTLDLARQAVAKAKAAGQRLVVHENFRFQPWYRAIKREIASGRLGQVYQLSFRLRPGDGQGPDAYLARQPYFQTMPRFLIHETGVHWIDTFRFLLGEPDAVQADLRRLNPAIAGEDSGFFLFHYPDGRRALFDGNRLADHPARNSRLTMGESLIEGSEGVLALDGEGAVSFRAKGETVWHDLGLAVPRLGFGGDCVYALQQHIVDHLLRNAPLENEAQDYIANMEIEAAVYAAAASGSRIRLEAGRP